MKFENLTVNARHVVQVGLIVASAVATLAIGGARLTAVEEDQDKQDKVVEQIRVDVAKLSTGQAVLSERMDTVIRQTEKTDEKLDRILERLSDR